MLFYLVNFNEISFKRRLPGFELIFFDVFQALAQEVIVLKYLRHN